MKNAVQTQIPSRKWPAAHGRETYTFAPEPLEMSRLRGHVGELERKLEAQAQRIADLVDKANRDSMTGLLNRRGMEEALGKAVANFERYGHKGALMMFDLNDFKRINDTFGHAAGDAVLRHVADALRENTRGTDSLCRLGGDEFMVFLVEANTANALVMARRLRAYLQENPVNYDGNVLVADISVGIATLSEAPCLPELIELADERMYRLKMALKNGGRS